MLSPTQQFLTRESHPQTKDHNIHHALRLPPLFHLLPAGPAHGKVKPLLQTTLLSSTRKFLMDHSYKKAPLPTKTNQPPLLSGEILLAMYRKQQD